MDIKFTAIDTTSVRLHQCGELDSNNQSPEKSISDGNGNPCRHCLGDIPKGKPMLILGFRPFSTLNPYAELGPIFLCGDQCCRYDQPENLPKLYTDRRMLLRGYDQNERIVYGTGVVVAGSEIIATAKEMFSNPEVVFIHARSPDNNCYHFRIDKITV